MKVIARIAELFGAEKAPNRNAIKRWRSGEYTPGLDHCYMLAIALGIDPAALALGDLPRAAKDLDLKPRRRQPAKAMREELEREGDTNGRRAG